jgi:hypothetical protein
MSFLSRNDAGPALCQREGSFPLALGEEDTAFGFVGAWVFVNDDRHGVGRGVTVADDGVGDVFDECTLLVEAAAWHHLDDYFGHTRSVR